MSMRPHALPFALFAPSLLALASACTHEVGAPPPLGAAVEAAIESGALTYDHATPGDRSLHIVNVDLCAPDIELVATGPSDGTRTVSSFAQRTGALIAINGGHSWSGEPGPSAHDGAFFGRPDAGDLGQAVFGDGLAQFFHQHESYAPAAGHSEVLTGLLTLVHDGVQQHDLLPHDSPTCAPQHPRTLIGLTADRRNAILVVVDGRAPSQGRRGMTCAEAADLMRFLGAHWALNLDGGGSSEMVVGGQIVNVPSDGQERPVPTHLAVVSRPGARGHCPDAPAPPPEEPAPPPEEPAPAPEEPAPACGVLSSGAYLLPNEAVTSCDGRFSFVLQGDGNVVLYDQTTGAALWNAGTHGRGGGLLVLQTDGNLVLYGPEWSVLWQTHTSGHAGASLAVQDDGNVVLYDGGAAAWNTQTCCR